MLDLGSRPIYPTLIFVHRGKSSNRRLRERIVGNVVGLENLDRGRDICQTQDACEDGLSRLGADSCYGFCDLPEIDHGLRSQKHEATIDTLILKCLEGKFVPVCLGISN